MKITDTVFMQLAHWCEFWKSCAGKLAKSTSQVTSKGLSWSVSYGRHAVRARVFAVVGAGTVTVPEACVQACVEAGVEFAKALFTLLVLASTTCCSSHFSLAAWGDSTSKRFFRASGILTLCNSSPQPKLVSSVRTYEQQPH